MRVTLLELWAREGMLHYASQLANSLAQVPGVQVTVLLPRGTERELFAPAVAVEYVEVVRDASPAELAAAPARLARLPHFLRTVEDTRPDILHLNNCHVWYWFTLGWLRRRYPVVATLHDVRPHPGLDDSWRKRREIAAVARGAHHLFVHGESLKAELLASLPRLAAETVHVVPHGDYSFLARYPSEATAEEPVALFFGRIRAYKGLEYLLQAAQIVQRELPSARFVIAGEGSLQPYRELLRRGRNLEVHNRAIPDAEVASLFRRASVVVLPYLEASQSGVVQVAYAFGKPVVTTAVGCLPEAVEEGKTGLLVPPGDAAALAEAVLALLRDEGRRHSLGQNGYRKMKAEFGWEQIAAKTVRVYEAALRQRTGAGGGA